MTDSSSDGGTVTMSGSEGRSDSRQRISGARPVHRAALGLPKRARLLVLGLMAAGTLIAGTVVVGDSAPISPLAVGLLAMAIAVGEALAVDLPYRRAGTARYALGDASLAAGLLLLSPNEVILAAALAAVVSQIVERSAPWKLAFNVAQYVAAAGAAAGAVLLLSGGATTITPALLGAAALGVALFTSVNTLSVSGIIALTSGESWTPSLRRMAPMAFVVALGTAALGLLAALLLHPTPWALPALGIPLVLLHTASRQEVRAQIDRERSTAYATFEQRLGETRNPDDVAAIIREGAVAILGCNAAVWRNGAWIGEVPAGSHGCPVDAELAHPLVARGPGLGPAVDGMCAAIGLGGGVLVIWQGELGVTSRSEDWLDRLARSGRAHFDRAAAASALDAERATLRAVVDGTADGICVTDADGLVRLWNPAMAALAETPTGHAMGRPVWQVLGDGPWTNDGIHDVMRGEDGDQVWRVSVSEIRDPAQGALRVAVVHDVSAERRVAKMKDDMLAVVSHELRTPLTPIKASSQLLRRCWDRMAVEDREELLERIEERSDHLARLVGDILLVAQMSSTSEARPKISRTDVDAVTLLREVAAGTRAAHPGHEIVTELPTTAPCTTDPLRLAQVAENLLDNACKFSPAGTEVGLALELTDEVLRVVVTDQGRGIPAEDLERVFERFERVEDPLIMTTSGAGLGLYIVRELVEALGGSIRLDSALGHGTVVTVELPRRAALLPLAPAEDHRVGSASSSRVSSSASPPSS